MSNYYCNPINYGYKYQFIEISDRAAGTKDLVAAREGADPSLINFKGRYYLFPSMTCGFLYTDDLVHWDFHKLKDMPTYDYAPDVRVRGDYIYFTASNHDKTTFYRTTDPFTDEWEAIEGPFDFWDPNQFFDDDGRMYFYYGSSTVDPIMGVELDPKTMKPLCEPVALVYPDVKTRGFERNGENHKKSRPQAVIDALIEQIKAMPMPEKNKKDALNYISEDAYLEGAWMNKHGDTYYLQIGETSSGHNIYSDVVYTSKSPLGPFTLAKNAPMSYKPGGYIPGAGHGSTMEDDAGNFWHIATERITINQNFERRVGLWPCGFDGDGDMFCNQRYGDWPLKVTGAFQDPWKKPDWMLLSYMAKASASSSADAETRTAAEGPDSAALVSKGPEMAVNEDIRTWWKAGTDKPGEWLMLDLGKVCDVHAVQVNFADDKLMPGLPEGVSLDETLGGQERWIDETPQKTRWSLEGSLDGNDWFMIEDKSQADTDLPHDLIVREGGFDAQFLRLTVHELPYGQAACVSGLRAFGLDREGRAPAPAAAVKAVRDGELDMDVTWEDGCACDPAANADPAAGFVVEWGYAPDKLYHSYQVFENKVHIAALVKDQPVYVRVDAWNRSGITEGSDVIAL